MKTAGRGIAVAAWLLPALSVLPALAAAQAAKRISLSPEEIASLVRRAVVVIECSTANGKESLGSGFYVDAAGLIATNAHVVAECSDILVRNEGSNEPVLGRLVLLDEELDIAIVAVAPPCPNNLRLAQPSSVVQGQRVYAVGHPEGLEYTVSEGIVSAFRDLGPVRLIQTTAPIAPGSSGGPLVDARGTVIGMMTAFLAEGQNLNFAVPARAIRHCLADAKRTLSQPGLLPVMSTATAARVAHSLRKRKQYDSAERMLQAALKGSPSSLPALLEMAELRFDEGRFEESEQLTRRMLEIDPNFAPAHLCLGMLLDRKGQRDEACREEERALALKPDETTRTYASYRLFLCEVSKDFEGLPKEEFTSRCYAALLYVDAALEDDELGARADLHAWRAGLLSKVGERKAANEEARQALTLTERLDEAKELLRKARLPEQEVRVVSLGQSETDKFLGLDVISGVVVNKGSDAVSFVRVIVECRDSTGTLIASGTGYVEPETLLSGESGSFEIKVKGPGATQMTCEARIAESRP